MIDCKNVKLEQLIQILEEGGGNDHYLYRGHKESSFELIPSALRPDSCPGLTIVKYLNKYIEENYKELVGNNNSGGDGKQDVELQDNENNRIMLLFYQLATEKGLKLPYVDRSNDYLSSHFIRSSGSVDDRTNKTYLKLASIAQHYGFPTLLLDWTRDPYCGLYFALTGVLDDCFKKINEGEDVDDFLEGSFSIWCLNADNVLYSEVDSDNHMKLFSFNHYDNMNIIAQKGILSHVTSYADNDTPSMESLKGEKVVKNRTKPFLIKYNVKKKELLQGLDILIKKEKMADAFFPGYVGIVNYMIELSKYQRVKDYLPNNRK